MLASCVALPCAEPPPLCVCLCSCCRRPSASTTSGCLHVVTWRRSGSTCSHGMAASQPRRVTRGMQWSCHGPPTIAQPIAYLERARGRRLARQNSTPFLAHLKNYIYIHSSMKAYRTGSGRDASLSPSLLTLSCLEFKMGIAALPPCPCSMKSQAPTVPPAVVVLPSAPPP